MTNEQAEARIALHKHYLRGKLIAAVAETVGDVNSVILAQISELVESCDTPLRYRDDIAERSYAISPPIAFGDGP